MQKRGVKSISIGVPEDIIEQVEKYHKEQNKNRDELDQLSKSQTYSMLIKKGLNNGNR